MTHEASIALASPRVDVSDKGEVYYYARWLAKKKKAEGYAVQFLDRAYQAVAEDLDNADYASKLKKWEEASS